MLKQVAKSRENSIICDFKLRVGHNLSDGKHKEFLVSQILNFIPKKYSVCNGFVIDSDGRKSSEIDIIIVSVKRYIS